MESETQGIIEDILTKNTFGIIEMPDGVRITAKDLPPSESKELLNVNPHNRPILMTVVNYLAQHMGAGTFLVNGDTMRLSRDKLGRHELMDAQHRLAAAVKMDVTLRVVIVSGLPPEAGPTIDQGRARSEKDILVQAYNRRPDNVQVLVPGARLLMVGNGLPVSKPQVAAYINGHLDELAPWAGTARSICRPATKTLINGTMRPILAPGPVMALMYHMVSEGAPVSLVEEFLRAIAEGHTNDDRSGVILALRRRLQKMPLNRLGGGNRHTMVMAEFSIFIKAYGKWLSSTPVGPLMTPRAIIRTFDDLPPVECAHGS